MKIIGRTAYLQSGYTAEMPEDLFTPLGAPTTPRVAEMDIQADLLGATSQWDWQG